VVDIGGEEEMKSCVLYFTLCILTSHCFMSLYGNKEHGQLKTKKGKQWSNNKSCNESARLLLFFPGEVQA
jgi:hypothetical protein